MNKALKNCKEHNTDEKKKNLILGMDSTDEPPVLLPGLPNHLAELCLSSLSPSLLSTVCRSWRHLIYSPSFPPFFSLYALLSPLNNSRRSQNALPSIQQGHRQSSQDQLDSIEFFSFDPILSRWQLLPNPPSDPPLRLLNRHPAFISRNLPIQSLTVLDSLVLIAASTPHFQPALSSPLVFDPLSNKWFYGPPLPSPRRWCATGSADGAVYVASGVGSNYQRDVARSLEKWDMKRRELDWKWEKMAGLKDVSFSREAVEAVGYKGKLYMVNLKGHAVKQGTVYDVAANKWEEMPAGMLSGWKGPAASTAAEDGEEVMYVVDEAKGALKKYDELNDSWEELIESSEYLVGAKQIAAGRGRVCAVCSDGRRIAVVDTAARPVRVWVVNPPPKMEVVSVHVLPRMSIPEC